MASLSSHEGRVHTTIADSTERDRTVYGTAVGEQRSNYAASVAELLGPSATLTPATSVNLDLRRGAVHTTTGIPHAIGGTATVVSQKVGLWLASFPDPIKAILGVGVHRDEKIIIKRKYCVGGGATIVPERAPARTVAIQEDVREVTLTRYGGDIEMNLNLFLTGEAEEELEMKLDCQKRELERTLVDIGYRMLLREGTLITDALIRSNPTYDPQDMDGIKYRVAARNMYESQIFGAINKFRFPVANLLAAAKYASAYSTCTQKGSVMILPHGVPELTTIARKEKMEYNVSGLQNNSKITMALDGGFTDPNSGVDILIHYPTPTYENGAANPTVNTKTCSLSDVSYILTVHGSDVTDKAAAQEVLPKNTSGTSTKYSSTHADATNATCDDAGKLDVFCAEMLASILSTGGPGNNADTALLPVVCPDIMNGGFHTHPYSHGAVLRIAKVSASSAILAAPGDSTGQLLIGYPFTGVSTSHAEERMRIQLRCYLGACLYQPDAVMILPNVFINGITKVEYHGLPSAKLGHFNALLKSLQNEDGCFDKTCPDYNLLKNAFDQIRTNSSNDGTSEKPATLILTAIAHLMALKETGELPVFKETKLSATTTECEIPRGTSYSTAANDKLEYQNVAAFGRLDDPVHYIGCHGVPQTYEGGKWDI